MTYNTNHKARIKDLKTLTERIKEDITKLNERTEAMTHDPASWKNLYYSGKNLGEFTADHLAAIKNGKYTGMGLGDRFTNTNAQGLTVQDTIVQFGGTTYMGDQNCIVLWRHTAITDAIGAKPSFNYPAQGTEGEEGYVPSTSGKYYPESNWYTYVRPLFIAEIEELYGANNVKAFDITVPTGMNGTTATGWTNLSSKAHLPSSDMLGLPLFTRKEKTGLCIYGQHQILPLRLVRPSACPNCAVLAERFGLGYYYRDLRKTFSAGFYEGTDGANAPSYGDWGHNLNPVFIVG